MAWLQCFAAALLALRGIDAKAVFAHFMVSNTVNYTTSDWEDDIKLAQEAHIDAFAMNIAFDQGDGPQIESAFSVAESKGFKLFFSFDYAGNGPWPQDQVIGYINQYKSSGAYYYYQGQPFVSTFEGPGSADDWVTIKAETACFFIPDWSSLGAKPAAEAGNGVADGLFSWAAWPWGPRDMNTYTDASYRQYLNGKPYMMPVSPWFYTNVPGYDKNWLWRGDDLWFDRWQEVLYVQPEFVEILTWNDWPESHYIGPFRENAQGAFTTGRAPYNYAEDMPHDGWRIFLPFAIDLYTKNSSKIESEGVSFWYRPQPKDACGNGKTVGNTASQLQIEFAATEVMQDKVFYTALLSQGANVFVSIGGVSARGSWTRIPDGGAGLYHGSVPFDGRTGEVVISISRGSTIIIEQTGKAITTDCGATAGLTNWNAWVGSSWGGGGAGATVDVSDYVCINGTGIDNFGGLCGFGCEYGYCPISACTCAALGAQVEKPESLNIDGFPAAGLDANYAGLCSFDCNLGYCPDNTCDTVSHPLTTPTVSPFTPNACVSGEGSGSYAGLCSYACNYGFCPRNICTCTGEGALIDSPPIVNDVTAYSTEGEDYGLCNFACIRGDYCPAPCTTDEDNEVSIDPAIWSSTEPTVTCNPPCNIILPPITYPESTVITFPPMTTTITEQWETDSSTTTVIVITFPPVTTTEVPVYNINITTSAVTSATYEVTPSIIPSTPITIKPPPGITPTQSPITVMITSRPKPGEDKNEDHPKTVHFTKGTPGPICSSGCGLPCLLFCSSCGLTCGGICSGCGAIDYPCVGSACPAGSSDPDDGDEPEECEDGATPTAIVTDCEVECVITQMPAPTSATTSCYTACSQSTACDEEATTTTSSTTLSCEAIAEYTPWYTDAENQDAPTLGDGGYGGQIVMTGGTSVSPAPTSGPESPAGADRYVVIAYETLNNMWWYVDITGRPWHGDIVIARGFNGPEVTDVNNIPFPGNTVENPRPSGAAMSPAYECTYVGKSTGPGTLECPDETIQCVTGRLLPVDRGDSYVYPKVQCYS